MSLDPVLKQLLDQVPSIPDGPIDYPSLRAQAASMLPMFIGPAGLAVVASVEDFLLESEHGRVAMRIYHPSSTPKGTLHFIHGGGWSIGDLPTVDHTARRLCRDLSMVVVTSTYRLAPEHPFPAAFDDSLAAAGWVVQNLERLGGRNVPAIIGGDSAGGNLAAAVCIAMRDSDSFQKAFDMQLLLYPAVDLRPVAFGYPSRKNDADPSLRTASIELCISDYVADADPADTRVSPLVAVNKRGLPPALIVVLSVDPLRDEAVAYASALKADGVPTELMEFSNLTHGFVHFAGIIPAADVATRSVIETCLAMANNLQSVA